MPQRWVKLIELMTNEPIYVNIYNIQGFRRRNQNSYTTIFMIRGVEFDVQETPDQILQLMGEDPNNFP